MSNFLNTKSLNIPKSGTQTLNEQTINVDNDFVNEGTLSGEKKPDNVLDHLAYVQNLYKETAQGLADSKKMAGDLNKGRNTLVDETEAFLGDLTTTITQGCLQKLKELNIEMANQKEENAAMTKEANDLKKECNQLQQLMLMVGKRLGNLEVAVGSYGPKTAKKK